MAAPPRVRVIASESESETPICNSSSGALPGSRQGEPHPWIRKFEGKEKSYLLLDGLNNVERRTGVVDVPSRNAGFDEAHGNDKGD